MRRVPRGGILTATRAVVMATRAVVMATRAVVMAHAGTAVTVARPILAGCVLTNTQATRKLVGRRITLNQCSGVSSGFDCGQTCSNDSRFQDLLRRLNFEP